MLSHLIPAARSPQPPSPSPLVFELTDGITGRTHLGRVAAVELAVTDGTGTFPTLCGVEVLAASLATPVGSTCTACHGQPHRRPGRAA